MSRNLGIFLPAALLITLFLNCGILLASDEFSIVLFDKYEIITFFGVRPDRPRSFHYGLDIKAEPGSPFLSPVDGTVYFKGFTPESSETLTIRCSNGYRVTILNLVNVLHEKGDGVKKGDLLGFVSSEPKGSTETPHLHLSLRDENGKYLDPLQFIAFSESFERFETEESEAFTVEVLPEEELSACSIVEAFPVFTQETGLNSGRAEKDLSQVLNKEDSVHENVRMTKNPVKEKSRLSNRIEPEMPGNRPAPAGKPGCCLDQGACSARPETAAISPEKNNRNFLISRASIIILCALLILSVAGIISAQSLLPAYAGGRLSPEGGETSARIRNNVHCEAPSYS